MTLPAQRFDLTRGHLVLLGSVQMAGAARPNQVAMSELEEANNWARLGAKLYFGWFMLMLVFNGLGMSWLFTRNGGIPDFANVIFIFFIMLNLASAVVVIFVRSYMLASGERMADVLKALNEQNGSGQNVQSPMPVLAINTVFYFSLAALFMLILFWVYLMGWGMAAISRAAGQSPASAVPTATLTPTATPTPTPTPTPAASSPTK